MHRKTVKRNKRTAKKFRIHELARVSGGKKVAKKAFKKAGFQGGSYVESAPFEELDPER